MRSKGFKALFFLNRYLMVIYAVVGAVSDMTPKVNFHYISIPRKQLIVFLNSSAELSSPI